MVLGETAERYAGVDKSGFRDDLDGGILFGLHVSSNSDPPFVTFGIESLLRMLRTYQSCPFQSSDRSSRDQSCLGRVSSAAAKN